MLCRWQLAYLSSGWITFKFFFPIMACVSAVVEPVLVTVEQQLTEFMGHCFQLLWSKHMYTSIELLLPGNKPQSYI